MSSEVLAHTETVRLSDGRTLAYAEFGSCRGAVLFYFHGHPGSRLEAGFLAAEAAYADVRLIGIDRPGIGQSSYQPGRRILDWPDDVVALASELQVDRFAVLGFSGGSPYAAACAYKIPDRLLACGIVSGLGRVSVFRSFLSRWLPWLLLPLTRPFFRDRARAQRMLARFARQWPEPDRESLRQQEVSALLAASLVEALSPGSKGPAYDGALLGKSWGFRLEDIAFPLVHLWHGECDRQAPLAPAQALANAIPHCSPTYYADEGHISVLVNHARDIVTTLSIDHGLRENPA